MKRSDAPAPRRRPAELRLRLRGVLRHARGLLGRGAEARHALVALGLNSVTSLLAGATLGSIVTTFDRYPGLLVMVPAAIGLRGNVFSALGSRLSTAIQSGELELTLRRRNLLGQNLEASMVLTLAMSVVLALLAWSLSVAFGVEDPASPLVLVGISVVGGLLGSVAVLVATLGLAWGAVRRDWDLDNVVAPVVSTLGDVLTLPALWIAAEAAELDVGPDLAGLALGIAALVLFGRAATSGAAVLRRVIRESWPVLVGAALLSTMAGLALQSRLEAWQVLPALLVLQPAFVSSAGALGGILSSRTSTKLHLGLVTAAAVPGRAVRTDALVVLGLALPVYLFNGAGAHVVARTLGHASPGLAAMVGVALLAALVAVSLAIVVAYYGTVAATAAQVDPDTYGIPIVTSAMDFVGVIAMVVMVAALSLLP